MGRKNEQFDKAIERRRKFKTMSEDQQKQLFAHAIEEANTFQEMCAIIDLKQQAVRNRLKRFGMMLPEKFAEERKRTSRTKTSKKGEVNNYWDEQEVSEWIQEFIRTRSEKLYSRIYPLLYKMSEIIYGRYFRTQNPNINYSESLELVADAVTKATEVLGTFDPNRGRSYSYFQAVIKWYFVDRVKAKETIFELIEDGDGHADGDDSWREIFDDGEIKHNALKHLQSLQHKWAHDETKCRVLKSLIDCITSREHYNRLFVTYFVLLQTRFTLPTLRRHTKEMRLTYVFVYYVKSLKEYENIIDKYLSKQDQTDENIQELFINYERERAEARVQRARAYNAGRRDREKKRAAKELEKINRMAG